MKRGRTDRKHVWYCWSVVGRVYEWRCPNCGEFETTFDGRPKETRETCAERIVRRIMEE